MRKYIFLCFIIFMGIGAKAQDLIITKKNDTINAKITKEDKKSIYFYYMRDGDVKSTLLLRSQVAAYQKNYFKNPEVSKNLKRPGDYDGKRFRLGIETGFAYRFGKIQNNLDPAVKNYLKSLRPGLHLGADVHYFITQNIALGARYGFFHSSTMDNNIQITYLDGTTEQGVTTDINLNYIGPSMLTRFLSSNGRNAFILGYGLGYLRYSSIDKTYSRSVYSTGGTFGVNLDIGYDIGLGKTFVLGFDISAISGNINKLTIEDNGTKYTVDLKDTVGSPESLAHFNLSVGLRANL